MTDKPKSREAGVTEGEEIFFTHYVEYIDYRLRRFFIKLIVAFAILGVCMGITALYTSHVSKENQRALCAIKLDAEDRIKQTEDFLEDNPDGIPGLSPAVLNRALVNYQHTAEALKDVSCE